ncbi:MULTISPECIES: LPS translocon maturation chaperone LptM [Shewanella]|uniref:Lipoprotein n=2 Tax=Shewanella TaxID=22 RepID=A0A975AL07_9GAMM|nr:MULTISPECIES: lipoprotein [Shewanella]QSX29763.1 lipoprotein [Shewanella cyperi]QSX36932.1 lipoprotein [Shewanella sedimentimangrovi]QSX40545.1 lipoprotein [Shewanella cyperi]
MKLQLSLLLVSLLVVGCGQKGPLYKTPPAADNQTQEQTDKDKAKQ